MLEPVSITRRYLLRACFAAGTVMPMAVPAAPRVVMRVDRPFSCALRDNSTGTLLFTGSIRDPQ